MPFEIIRSDIANMRVDAIVNSANPKAAIGYGVDAGIHKKAGPRLLEARKEIGAIGVGRSAVTPAFGLDAKYVIHTVAPVWQGGSYNEEVLLGECYRSALELARERGCTSVAFPLLAAGNDGFPKARALQIAVKEFSRFLMENEMQVYMVVFDRDSFVLSEKLSRSVASYIDETYIRDKDMEEHGIEGRRNILEAGRMLLRRKRERRERIREENPQEPSMPLPCMPAQSESAARPFAAKDLEPFLEDVDAGFSETLLQFIDRTGKKDSDIYKKANIDRKLFSKIRNNAAYKPSKMTAVAFALALELNLEETRNFIARAGYALSHSSKFDIIVEYFILHGNYDVFELNEVLFAFDQPLIGA